MTIIRKLYRTHLVHTFLRLREQNFGNIKGMSMVLISDGNLDIGCARIFKNLFNAFDKTARAVINQIQFLSRIFFFMLARHVLSYHLISVPWECPNGN